MYNFLQKAGKAFKNNPYRPILENVACKEDMFEVTDTFVLVQTKMKVPDSLKNCLLNCNKLAGLTRAIAVSLLADDYLLSAKSQESIDSFPDPKACFPQSKPLATIKLDAKLLKKALMFFDGEFELEVREYRAPVILKDANTKAIVMPKL